MLHLADLSCLLKKRVPGQLVIQFTDHCNARCPQCGMRRTHRFRRSKLDDDHVKRLLDAASEKGFQVVSFTGGEPFLFWNDLLDFIRYAGSVGIGYIRTGTNGFVFAGSTKRGFKTRIERKARQLAATPLRNLWISVDSAIPSVHEEMRGLPGVIAGIEKALPVFHRHGIFPAANLGINRRIGGAVTADLVPAQTMEQKEYLEAFYVAYREAFRRFFRFVKALGFTMVNMCYPMSFEPNATDDELAPVYAANSQDRIVRFTTSEKAVLFKAVADTVPEFRSQIRVFSPRSSLYALYHQYNGGSQNRPYPCRGGIDFFFIDSKDGNTYPCGFRGGENLGKLWAMNGRRAHADCRLCDWECFRDPSELFGPVLEGLSSPLSLLKRFKDDRRYFGIWCEDLRYYRACGLFDGRRAPDATRLAAFHHAVAPIQ
jgi:hypothetical protein